MCKGPGTDLAPASSRLLLRDFVLGVEGDQHTNRLFCIFVSYPELGGGTFDIDPLMSLREMSEGEGRAVSPSLKRMIVGCAAERELRGIMAQSDSDSDEPKPGLVRCDNAYLLIRSAFVQYRLRVVFVVDDVGGAGVARQRVATNAVAVAAARFEGRQSPLVLACPASGMFAFASSSCRPFRASR